MAWTDDQWAVFTTVIERGFAARDAFTQADADVYRLLLDDVDPDAAMRAVKAAVLEGQALRPRPGEIVARARRDAGQPTFDEAYQLIYGPHGVLAARPESARGAFTYATEAERRGAINLAGLQRAAELHPLIGHFVARQGLDRLRGLAVDDPQYGELRRKELRDAWTEHVRAFDGREIAALAAGDPTRTGLRQLDPLTALGISIEQRELESGPSTGEAI